MPAIAAGGNRNCKSQQEGGQNMTGNTYGIVEERTDGGQRGRKEQRREMKRKEGKGREDKRRDEGRRAENRRAEKE